MKNKNYIKRSLSFILLYVVCGILVCFFTFLPVIQAVSQMDVEDVELCEDTPNEDDTEDDTEELRELKNEWKVNPYLSVSIANADDVFQHICDEQRNYFDCQHIEIPKQPPRILV